MEYFDDVIEYLKAAQSHLNWLCGFGMGLNNELVSSNAGRAAQLVECAINKLNGVDKQCTTSL